jgi:hypothetical protein
MPKTDKNISSIPKNKIKLEYNYPQQILNAKYHTIHIEKETNANPKSFN